MANDVSDQDRRWTPVRGFPRYLISKSGEVKSFGRHGRPMLMKPCLNRQGYLKVCLYQGGKKSYCFIATLMLQTFVGKRPPKHEAAHLNGVKTDNRLSNLKWVTRTENERHKKEHGTVVQGETHYNARLSKADVLAIRKALAEGVSHRTLAKQFGVVPANIGAIYRRESWKGI